MLLDIIGLLARIRCHKLFWLGTKKHILHVPGVTMMSNISMRAVSPIRKNQGLHLGLGVNGVMQEHTENFL